MSDAGTGPLARMGLEQLVARRTRLSRRLDEVLADIALVSRELEPKAPPRRQARKAAHRTAGRAAAAGGPSGGISEVRAAVAARLREGGAMSVREIATGIMREGGGEEDDGLMEVLSERIRNALTAMRKAGEAVAERHGTHWRWRLAPKAPEAG